MMRPGRGGVSPPLPSAGRKAPPSTMPWTKSRRFTVAPFAVRPWRRQLRDMPELPDGTVPFPGWVSVGPGGILLRGGGIDSGTGRSWSRGHTTTIKPHPPEPLGGMAMKSLTLILGLVWAVLLYPAALRAADPKPPTYELRWVWCMHNLQVKE